MAKGVKVTEKKFRAIKILIESGATTAEITESMDVSKPVVTAVRKAATYEEYKHFMYVSSSGYRKKMAAQLKAKQEEEAKEAQEQPATATPEKEEAKPVNVGYSYLLNKIAEQLRQQNEKLQKQNEYLVLISNKVAFIVDELTK